MTNKNLIRTEKCKTLLRYVSAKKGLDNRWMIGHEDHTKYKDEIIYMVSDIAEKWRVFRYNNGKEINCSWYHDPDGAIESIYNRLINEPSIYQYKEAFMAVGGDASDEMALLKFAVEIINPRWENHIGKEGDQFLALYDEHCCLVQMPDGKWKVTSTQRGVETCSRSIHETFLCAANQYISRLLGFGKAPSIFDYRDEFTAATGIEF